MKEQIFKGLYPTDRVRGIWLSCLIGRDAGGGRWVYEDPTLKVAWDRQWVVVHRSNVVTLIDGRTILSLPWSIGPRMNPIPIIPR